MKRSKFSEAQIAFVLKQAEDGTTIGEVCRKAGISDATFYAWRKKYAGSDAVGDAAVAAARRRECQAQAAWWLTCRLDKAMLQDVVSRKL